MVVQTSRSSGPPRDTWSLGLCLLGLLQTYEMVGQMKYQLIVTLTIHQKYERDMENDIQALAQDILTKMMNNEQISIPYKVDTKTVANVVHMDVETWQTEE